MFVRTVLAVMLVFIVSSCKEDNKKPEEPKNLSTNQEGAAPVVRKAKQNIGRNDPCPCGSGKKYKNCCGQGK